MKLLWILFVLSPFALAQEVELKVLQRVKQNEAFELGIGSKVELYFKTKNESKDALFLGRMVDQEGKNLEFLFLDEAKTRISMIDPENVSGFRKNSSQPVIWPIDQKGSTCMAYAVFHYWNQIYAMKLSQNPELVKTMSSDRERMRFLEETIEIYYIQNKTNVTNLMTKLGKRYGMSCRNHLFQKPKDAVDFIYRKTTEGKPVLIDFNISRDMVTSTYEVTDFEKPLLKDARLWLPRKKGQRMTSGHAIVGASGFIAKGRKKVLVLDSDWTEPRIWDLEKYLGAKTAVKEMNFHTCD